jgi:hypothetical protein
MAIRVQMIRDQRHQGSQDSWGELLGPLRLRQQLLEHERVDIDHAVFRQVQSYHAGLALDGTGAGRTYKEPCSWCDPVIDAQGVVHGSLHHFVMISVVGAGLTLPVDVEPYGAGDSEYAAAQRLLERTVAHLGPRFADYLMGDSAYSTAPFLHTTQAAGLPVVARLIENLSTLAAAVRARFEGQPPQAEFQEGEDRVEVWDAEDFDPC